MFVVDNESQNNHYFHFISYCIFSHVLRERSALKYFLEESARNLSNDYIHLLCLVLLPGMFAH